MKPMPELPEVETIVRRLNPLLTGRQIQSVQVKREKSFQGKANEVVGAKVTKVWRRAKLVIINLDNQKYLLIHLKMTGQLIFVDKNQKTGGGHPTKDWLNQLPGKHTRVVFRFLPSGTLFFNDMRVFGWVKVVDEFQLKQELQKYGPDIVDAKLTADKFYHLLQSSQRAVKLVILDSHKVAGIGNIYACDGLNLAKISPFRPANSLTLLESNRLLRSLRQVVKLGIKHQGATVSDYMTADGVKGGYQKIMRVYAKEGLPCPNCGAPIRRAKQGGRSTYWCDRCQK